MTISLPAESEKAIERKVESGLYSDPSDVIREALRQLDEGHSTFVHTKEEFMALVRKNP
jgi:putative addiction module CopG family antidote